MKRVYEKNYSKKLNFYFKYQNNTIYYSDCCLKITAKKAKKKVKTIQYYDSIHLSTFYYFEFYDIFRI